MRLRVLGLACALVAGLFVTVTASAASFPRIAAATVDTYRMTAGQTFENYCARITQLERNTQLKPRGLSEILTSANRKARPLCHGTYVASALKPAGFCWEDANDDKTNDWIPQGLTGSGDASPTGKVDGKRVVAAS